MTILPRRFTRREMLRMLGIAGTGAVLPRTLVANYGPPPPTQLSDLSALTATNPILISEDDPDQLRLYELILNRANLKTMGTVSGVRTLEICQNAPVSLLVSDIMKPEIDGFEILQRLRANHATRRIPILFVSCILYDEQRAQFARDLGADGYMVKPIWPSDLLTAVQTLLMQRGCWSA